MKKKWTARHSHLNWPIPSAIGIIRLAFKIDVKTDIGELIVICDGHLGRGLSLYMTRVTTMSEKASTAIVILNASQSQSFCDRLSAVQDCL